MRVLQQKLEPQEPETPMEVSLFYYVTRADKMSRNEQIFKN